MPRRKMPTAAAAENDAEPQHENVETADDLALETFTRRFTDVRKVSIRRFDDSKDKYVHVATVPAEMVSEDYLQRKFKGGSYQLSFHDADGCVVTKRTGIEIADPVVDENKSAPVAAPLQTILLDPVTLMQQQLQRQHEIQLAMINNQKSGGGLDFSSLIPLLDFLKPQPAPGVKEMMDIFMKGMEMNKGGGEEGGGLGALGSILAPLVTPALVEKLQQRRALKVVEKVPAIEEGGDMELLRYIVDTVKPMALADIDPAVMVKMAMAYAQADPDQYALLRDLIAEPFTTLLADLGKVDPLMMQQPIAGWLQNFYLRLNDAIQSDANPGRAGRDQEDTSGNGSPGSAVH